MAARFPHNESSAATPMTYLSLADEIEASLPPATVHKGEMPFDLPDSTLSDPSARADHERRERCLFYVASTRGRDELVVTGFGGSSSVTAVLRAGQAH